MSSFLSSRKKQTARKTSSSGVNNHVPRDALRERLNRIFDQYKGTTLPGTEVDELDVSSSEDIMNIEGTMSYFQAIGLDPEDPVGLALAYQLDAPSLGVFNRQGFVDGWRTLGCDNIQSMTTTVGQLRGQFKVDDQFHKRVYLFTYAFAKPEGQRALPLDMAIEFWKLLLMERYVYLDLWIEFLWERYKKSIPKDTWNLLYDFIQDIGTDFDKYDENGAWPVIIDEFVAYGKEKVACGYDVDKMVED